MKETLAYVETFAQLPLSLRRFARHRLTLGEAERIVRERMERREEIFLRTVERSVYGHPASPYLTLLKLAGCELGDLQALVRQKGLEGALRALRDEGVYVTFEEFKGRKPIVRYGKVIPVSVRDFDNPFMERAFTIQSSGSTGAATNVGVNLEQIAAQAPHELLTLSAHGLLDAPVVRWNNILPAGTLRSILRSAYIGHAPQRWFSPLGLRDSKYWLKYALATYYILAWLRICGVRVPLPEYVKVEQASVVARCVADLLQARGRCVLNSNLSLSMRVCLAAQEAGLDLGGATFQGSSEPATPAKTAYLERAGVRFVSNYGMVEASRIASGCAQPVDVGDVHLHKDAFALLAYPHPVEGSDITVPAFNLTTLLPTASKVMLNVQIDDYGIVEERHCGCELETCGYSTHLRQIRSYSKLTGEGVTLIGTEMLHVLEEVLPARFGGSPLDYQMVEQEDEQGFTRLYVLIDPKIMIADERDVIEAILSTLRQSSPMADAARTVWQQMQTIRVRRAEPILTGRGKLMPLHIQRRLEN
ncbi:MAG TPA: hypothetical protein VJ714_05090 [Anaerolineae bacterium]|nr:hypothetical protein [Anaerolineae bacterium]